MKALLYSILSKWFFVGYFVLGLICFFAFPSILSWVTWSKSFFITLGLMTGSDPYSFKDHIESYGFVWVLAWMIHIASWLLIPALVALVITETKTKLKDQQQLERGLRDWVIRSGAQERDVDRVTAELLGQINEPKKPQKKGEVTNAPV
jgi:hypothetical protein